MNEQNWFLVVTDIGGEMSTTRVNGMSREEAYASLYMYKDDYPGTEMVVLNGREVEFLGVER